LSAFAVFWPLAFVTRVFLSAVFLLFAKDVIFPPSQNRDNDFSFSSCASPLFYLIIQDKEKEKKKEEKEIETKAAHTLL
jgi:hypothetical protein